MKKAVKSSVIDVGDKAPKSSVHPIVGYSCYTNRGGGFHIEAVQAEVEIDHLYLRQLVSEAACRGGTHYDGPLTIRILKPPFTALQNRSKAEAK